MISVELAIVNKVIPLTHTLAHTQAFDLHDSSEEEAGDEEDQSFIWKGCVIIVGTYFFFLFETILHSLTAHRHTHEVNHIPHACTLCNNLIG